MTCNWQHLGQEENKLVSSVAQLSVLAMCFVCWWTETYKMPYVGLCNQKQDSMGAVAQAVQVEQPSNWHENMRLHMGFGHPFCLILSVHTLVGIRAGEKKEDFNSSEIIKHWVTLHHFGCWCCLYGTCTLKRTCLGPKKQQQLKTQRVETSRSWTTFWAKHLPKQLVSHSECAGDGHHLGAGAPGRPKVLRF